MRQRLKGVFTPAVLLFFLSPAIAELLSGSMPPGEFFSPFAFLLVTCLYGSGAILARELALRSRRSEALLILGAAYGIVEEGLAVKSFFDPGWQDIGVLGSYGRWAGVNWVWSVELTLYHAVFSIVIPVLLVTLLFPARRAEPWVSGAALKRLAVLFAAEVAFMFFLLTPYRPPLVPYVLAVAAVIILVLLARRGGARAAVPAPETGALPVPPRPRRFAVLGFLATVALFVLAWAVPASGIPALVTIALMAALAALVRWIIRRWSRGGRAWTDEHRLALASGALGFFVLLAPLQELDKTRADGTAGMTLVALALVIFLAWLWRRVRRAAGLRPALAKA